MAKSKLTPEVQKKIVDAIAAGCHDVVAAGVAGIHKATFYRWLEAGESAQAGIFCDFCAAVKKAEFDAEARNVVVIQKAAADTWTASAWWLERKHPDRWARTDKAKIEHTGKDGDPIKFAEVPPDEEALLLAAEAIKRKRASVSDNP